MDIGQIIKWCMVGLLALGALNIIMKIGKPRDPITPKTAATVTVMQAMWITAIIVFWN